MIFVGTRKYLLTFTKTHVKNELESDRQTRHGSCDFGAKTRCAKDLGSAVITVSCQPVSPKSRVFFFVFFLFQNPPSAPQLPARDHGVACVI